MIGPGLSLADPSGGTSLVAAVYWVRALVTGTGAAAVATIAVAAVGFFMLQGRLPLRRGIIVVLGCFIIFGAGMIADGLLAIGKANSAVVRADVTPALPPPPVAPPQPSIYDPYAGAAVPVR